MQLPEQIREAIVAHAAATHPDEACGLLAADVSGRLRMVYCLTNAAASPIRYALDPVEHFRALQHAERCGWDIAGVYHSHPAAPAYPSPIDIAEAGDPDWLYVIVGPATDPEVRGYRIRGGRVQEVPL